MPQYKLTYFDLRAVAEPIRLIFIAAGVPFEDDRIPRDSWAEIKQTKKFGFGQMPILYVDGKQITQSLTIGRYLGKMLDLMPKDEFLAVRCDEVVDFLTECRLEFRSYFLCKDEAAKAAAKTQFIEEVAPKYYRILTELIEEEGSGPFICGEKLCWADLFVANWLEIFEELLLTEEFTKKYPVLAKHKASVYAVPAIATYLEGRRKTII